MESKQVVLSGLVITALLTAIILSGWIPYIIIAIVILIAGILTTYFIALNEKRGQRSFRLMIIIKALQEIGQQNTVKESMERVARWSRRLLEIDQSLVIVSGENGFQVGDDHINSFITSFPQPMVMESDIWVEINKDEFAAVDWPPGVAWLAAYPIIKHGKERAVLFLAHSKPHKLNPKLLEELDLIVKQGRFFLKSWFIQKSIDKEEKVLIKAFLTSIDAVNPVFSGHSERVYAISNLIASKMGLDDEEVKVLKYSTWLHDIGKIIELSGNIDEDNQVSLTKDHASLGAENIPESGIFKQVREAVRYHHEHYDGSGFPLGLSRTDIPLIARIIAVADFYDALTRLSTEEERVSPGIAITLIKKGSGTLFDPLVIVALEEAAPEIELLTAGYASGE
ncbi:MAG: HD-GYP domain-containing protein [Syntrophomonadaceae bacterium]|jgi:putative nucleotidyltransferase with HDIG domain